MKVVEIPEGALCVDCYEPTTAASLDALLAAGIETTDTGKTLVERPVAVGRYVENTTPEELATILGKGLGYWSIGEAPDDSMAEPSMALGTRDGLRAFALLRHLGILSGVTHVLDVEGCAKASGRDVASYINAAAQCVKVQTECALYRGWGINMTAEELYQWLSVTLYYASSPESVPPAIRDFVMVQTRENVTIAGRKYDLDRHRKDKLGGVFHMLVADDWQPAV